MSVRPRKFYSEGLVSGSGKEAIEELKTYYDSLGFKITYINDIRVSFLSEDDGMSVYSVNLDLKEDA